MLIPAMKHPTNSFFPGMFRFPHGLDYHRNLCRVLDAEIEKKEQEIWALAAKLSAQ